MRRISETNPQPAKLYGERSPPKRKFGATKRDPKVLKTRAELNDMFEHVRASLRFCHTTATGRQLITNQTLNLVSSLYNELHLEISRSEEYEDKSWVPDASLLIAEVKPILDLTLLAMLGPILRDSGNACWDNPDGDWEYLPFEKCGSV